MQEATRGDREPRREHEPPLAGSLRELLPHLIFGTGVRWERSFGGGLSDREVRFSPDGRIKVAGILTSPGGESIAPYEYSPSEERDGVDRDIAAILKTSGELKAEIVAIVGDLTHSVQHPFDLYKERPELIEGEIYNCLREFGGLKGLLDFLIATKKLEEKKTCR